MYVMSKTSQYSDQLGVGLLEVLLALLLLSISIFGYSALQLRAMHAAREAGHYIDAVNLAKDLAERMRVNRRAAMQNVVLSTKSAAFPCVATMSCTAQALADYDFRQVSQKAQALAMHITISPCQNTVIQRQCIYVAWRQAGAVQNQEIQACSQAAHYRPQARCVVMEVYPDAQ